jgi:hypothetical protein
LLVRLRRDLWRNESPPVLAGEVVDRAVERHGPLPDELLAYCAALGSLAMLLSDDEELEAFYQAQAEPNWRVRSQIGDHVAFDAWGDWPRTYAVYSPSERSFGVFDLKTGTMQRAPTLEHVVAQRIDGAPDAADFTPIIRREIARERHVTHAKFGTGTVLEALEGKLRIDFGGEHGVKVLAERFVKDA